MFFIAWYLTHSGGTGSMEMLSQSVNVVMDVIDGDLGLRSRSRGVRIRREGR
jgi:hypothetical protein